MNIPTIETERLRLRAFEGGDLESYAEMCADNRFMHYIGGKTLARRGGLLGIVAEVLGSRIRDRGGEGLH